VESLLKSVSEVSLIPAVLNRRWNKLGFPLGITADSTYYSTQLGDTPLYNFIDDTGALRNTTIGPAFWDALALLPSGTKITMNLVRNYPISLISVTGVIHGALGLARPKLYWSTRGS
jgi:hypothetical protein